MIYYLFTFTGLWFTRPSIMYQNKISLNLNPYILSYIVKKTVLFQNTCCGKFGKKSINKCFNFNKFAIYNSSFNRMILLIFRKIDRCWKFKFLKYCYLDWGRIFRFFIYKMIWILNLHRIANIYSFYLLILHMLWLHN